MWLADSLMEPSWARTRRGNALHHSCGYLLAPSSRSCALILASAAALCIRSSALLSSARLVMSSMSLTIRSISSRVITGVAFTSGLLTVLVVKISSSRMVLIGRSGS